MYVYIYTHMYIYIHTDIHRHLFAVKEGEMESAEKKRSSGRSSATTVTDLAGSVVKGLGDGITKLSDVNLWGIESHLKAWCTLLQLWWVQGRHLFFSPGVVSGNKHAVAVVPSLSRAVFEYPDLLSASPAEVMQAPPTALLSPLANVPCSPAPCTQAASSISNSSEDAVFLSTYYAQKR